MHIAVLQKEVLQFLNPKPNENFIDCTIGGGGHALAILEKTQPDGKLLGIDADPNQIENCKLKIENFKKRIILVADNFANLKTIVKRERFGSIRGILFDLGLSSWHLEESGRGFTFKKREPLDMRYNVENSKLTAEKIINYYSFQEIEGILREGSQERFSKKIAREIVNKRSQGPITNTFQLVEIVRKAVPAWYRNQRIHFATRTFQALRIAVNNELNNLKKALPRALEILKPGGRLVVISFHSLEDQIVKNFLKENQDLVQVLTRKPLGPTPAEIKINPRCRSAKLRACIKINL